MRDKTQAIVEKIGETDQLFLAGNTAELALERADLRLQLVGMSHSQREQVYFLQEAIVLLEHARVEFEEIPYPLYLDLSLHLAKAYMTLFELSQETRYALITQQILKPLSKSEDGRIFLLLAYACAAKQEPALCRHWLTKYSRSKDFDMESLKSYPLLNQYQQEVWFQSLIQYRLH